ncbi:hypothetical protein DPMN_107082 [Dreissena polymorpha]|uniref:Uncharacterized protein n=1 Tax=Dreissena polymorpha TaxID=45954 RepID=A0A9D4K676_DREPO|nr:hypothetical protein DPMN_107082 [Dreissena polymorpha]
MINKTAPKTNVLSKIHENWAKNVTSTVEKCPAHWRPCFFTDPDHFKIVRDINKTNVLTNFHDGCAKIVTSRVFTRENCHYIHKEKNARPLVAMKTAAPTGGHDFHGSEPLLNSTKISLRQTF